MFFLFLFLLTEIEAIASYSFQHANITVETVSTGSVANPLPAPDACGEMIAKSNMLHHINHQQTYEGFHSGKLNPAAITIPVVTTPATLVDMGVDGVYNLIAFISTDTLNIQVYWLDTIMNSSNYAGSFTTMVPRAV